MQRGFIKIHPIFKDPGGDLPDVKSGSSFARYCRKNRIYRQSSFQQMFQKICGYAAIRISEREGGNRLPKNIYRKSKKNG